MGTNFPEPTLNSTKNPYASWITAPALETLLKQVGANNELEPNLATSWTQTGPDTYVYHLRQGVKFWDGNEMTTADVAFSYNYWRCSGLGSGLSGCRRKEHHRDGAVYRPCHP